MQASTQNGNREVLIQCHRCGRKRVYRGKNPYFTICNFCRTTVSIKKSKIETVLPEQDSGLIKATPVTTSPVSDEL